MVCAGCHEGKGITCLDEANASAQCRKDPDKYEETKRSIKMNRKEALLIAEEILRMMVFNRSGFEVSMQEYICNKLDISSESLTEAFNVISKENEYD